MTTSSVAANPPGLLLAHGSPIFQAGVRDTLSAHGFHVLAVTDCASDVAELAVQFRPQLVLIDAGLPGVLDVVRIVSEAQPAVLVIAIVDQERDDRLVSILVAGAVGYVDAGVSPQRLVAGVRTALAGEVLVPRRLVFRLVTELRSHDGHRGNLDRRATHRLTDRELEVLRLVQLGLSTSAIAERLFIEPVTVRCHISATLHKLGLVSRADITCYPAERRRSPILASSGA